MARGSSPRGQRLANGDAGRGCYGVPGEPEVGGILAAGGLVFLNIAQIHFRQKRNSSTYNAAKDHAVYMLDFIGQ